MNAKLTSVVVAVLLLVNNIAVHGGYGPVRYASGGYGPVGYASGGYGGNVGGNGPVGYGGLGGLGGFEGFLSSGLSSRYANPRFWMEFVPKQYAGNVQKYATVLRENTEIILHMYTSYGFYGIMHFQ
ncbi:shematrin-like protein 2 [Mytilus trossulus]|uniref:shematrin-like protein 2 n=1 Tax=Mytilus trossulus TaxID=6551 RepID=UPI003006BA77